MRIGQISGRLLAGGTAALVAMALVGCTSTGPTLPTAEVAPAPPRPVGVQDPAVIPSGSAAASDSCDPRASLRPRGALPAPGRMPAGSAMAQIVQRGRLVVGVDQNSYRFGFRDPLSGELTGFDVGPCPGDRPGPVRRPEPDPVPDDLLGRPDQGDPGGGR